MTGCHPEQGEGADGAGRSPCWPGRYAPFRPLAESVAGQKRAKRARQKPTADSHYMEQANETFRQSRHKIRTQLRKLSWLGETQAALGWGVIVIIGALVGTLYVGQASRIAEQGRTTQALQFELAEVKRNNAQLEREIAEAQSLELLESRARELGFVRSLPEDIEYLVVESYPPDLATPVPQLAAEADEVKAESLGQAIWWYISSNFSDMVRGESRDR